ncbi:hypothetical protein BHE74_00053196 [Ensete ventricosum]|nr:hypothetical protein GW17_00056219 [Ensete ventricosum]RWW41326.1 hypothetical protein BHE74_00053196 [Ensete ventricosum]
MINLDRRGPDPWNGFAIRTRERALSVGERGRRLAIRGNVGLKNGRVRDDTSGSAHLTTKRLTARLVTSAHRGKDNDSRFKSFHAVSSRMATRPGWVLSTASKDKNVGHT